MHLGIDLGGTKTEIIALDNDSTELFRKRVPSAQNSYQQTLETISQLILATEQQLQQIGTVGIGIPGALSRETGLIKNANSTWLIGHDLKNDLSETLERVVSIANDADCFTLSEATDGAAKGAGAVFGVILGTGVGGGICVNGSMLDGPNSITGEWGHNPLPIDNRQPITQQTTSNTQCYCGKYNCIESYLSGPAFLEHYRQYHANTEINSAIELAHAISIKTPDAMAYYHLYLDRLARSLSCVINTLDPDVIVFGGGVSNISAIYEDLPNAIASYIFSDKVGTRFLPALHGDSSGVRGAAWLGSENKLR